MRGKYIVFGDAGFPQAVAFSETIVHADMAHAMRMQNILGAGFFVVAGDLFNCYGESISCRVKSRGGVDSDVLNQHLAGVVMSKQPDAKEKQGYVAKAIPQVCGNCAHYRCDMELPPWMQEENKLKPGTWEDNYLQENNKRCGLGGFAVKKMGTCNEWGGAE